MDDVICHLLIQFGKGKMKRQTFNLNFLKLQIPQPFQKHSRNGSVTPHRPVKFPIICAANRLGSSEEDLLPPGGIHVKSPSLAPDPICNQLARELLLLMMCSNQQQQQQQRKIQNISSSTRTSPRVFIKGRGTLCSGPHSIVGSRFFSLLYFPLIRFLFWPFFRQHRSKWQHFYSKHDFTAFLGQQQQHPTYHRRRRLFFFLILLEGIFTDFYHSPLYPRSCSQFSAAR